MQTASTIDDSKMVRDAHIPVSNTTLSKRENATVSAEKELIYKE